MLELKFDFSGKTVLITGAASGMGLLCGQCFAKAGANVVLTDVNEAALQEKTAEIVTGGGKCVYRVLDVRNYDEAQKTCQFAVDTFGSLDIVINSAGGSAKRIWKAGGDLLETPIEVFDWGIDVNLKGPLYLGLSAMKYMKEQKSGVIINFGSVTGAEGDANGIDYPVAKSAVMGGLTKSLAMYGAQYGVRCCCVSPGPVLTRANMQEMPTLLGRAAEPIELVNMVLYLASDYAAFITGTNYFVDGGRLLEPNKTWGSKMPKGN